MLLHDRLTRAKERLDNAIETLALICEPVEPPKQELQHIHYFCGNTEVPTDLQEREPRRTALYKATVAIVRAYANLKDELSDAGYADSDISRISEQLVHYVRLRDTIRNAAGEKLDLKTYEADMRHLLDTYIEADEPRTISPFENLGLLDLIVKTGIADAIAARLVGLKGNKDAIAETIENNVRSKIIKEQVSDPAFYETMSELLDEVIANRKAKAIAYEEYLKRIADIVKKVDAGKADDTPAKLNSPGKRAIFNVLKQTVTEAPPSMVAESGEAYAVSGDPMIDLAVAIHDTILANRPDGWRGVQSKEQKIKKAIHEIVLDVERVERIFMVIATQKEY